jgi:predicted SprT family Zn-dependent metalloprotease
MTRQVRGITLPYDLSQSGISMVHIRLNKTMFRLETKEEIWGTILHEMLHAYLDLTTGWVSLRVPHHGVDFERSCEAMVGRLGLRGLEVRHVV